MPRIVAIAGSLRRGSFNAALLRAAAALAPEGVTLEIATIKGIPLYGRRTCHSLRRDALFRSMLTL